MYFLPILPTLLIFLLTTTTTATILNTTNSTTTCYSYILLSLRGTKEPQGPCLSLEPMINKTLAAVPNGSVYNVVYPAAWAQTYELGSEDAVRFINTGLQRCPAQRYALLGYSQGASGVMGALQNFTNTSSAWYEAVSAALVIGNPYHDPNRSADIDQYGGTSTAKYSGILYDAENTETSGIPGLWYDSGKVLDICYQGDIICCPNYPNASVANHLRYAANEGVQDMAAKFLIGKLSAKDSAASTLGRNSSVATSSAPTGYDYVAVMRQASLVVLLILAAETIL